METERRKNMNSKNDQGEGTAWVVLIVMVVIILASMEGLI